MISTEGFCRLCGCCVYHICSPQGGFTIGMYACNHCGVIFECQKRFFVTTVDDQQRGKRRGAGLVAMQHIDEEDVKSHLRDHGRLAEHLRPVIANLKRRRSGYLTSGARQYLNELEEQHKRDLTRN